MSDLTIVENGPFISISNDAHPSTQEYIRGMEYVGQSQSRKLYWNKGDFSLGLLCGSSIQQIDTVVRQFAHAHLVKHSSTPSPRILVLHTGQSAIHQSPCSVLDAMHILGSPRNAPRSPNHRPLRLREQDISLRHILALFTPPPDMHSALSSKILNSIQYVVSRLHTPFDLQTFIQLIEEEKWDDESSSFVALRQTILTELLAPDEMDDAGHAYWSLDSVDTVTIDLSDPILGSMRLDSVLMDMALHAFLNSAVDRDERTLIVLSAAHQYLCPSSPLINSLQWLVSQQERGISILINTTNPLALYIPSFVSNSIDYIAVVGPIRSRLWLEPLRAHFVSVDMANLFSSIRSENMFAILSPESRHLERVEDAEHWSEWGDTFLSFDVSRSMEEALPEPPKGRVEQAAGSGKGVSILEVSSKSIDQTHRHQDLRSTEESKESRKMEQPGTSLSLDPLLSKISQQEPQPSIYAPGIQWNSENGFRLDQALIQPESDRKQFIRKKGATARDDDSDSIESYEGHDDSAGISLTEAKDLDIESLFHLVSDLSPLAFIKSRVEASIYPEQFRLLVSEILRSTAGYSNALVRKTQLKRQITPFIKDAKRSGSPTGFKNFNNMAEKAWIANIIRFSTEGTDSYVYLVNPTVIMERLGPSGMLKEPRIGTSQGSGWKPPADFRAHTTSPFLPIVRAIARNGGSVAGVPVRLKLVRQDVEGAVNLLSLGFLKFSLYVKEAVQVQLVTVHFPAVTSVARTISLRANWDHLQSILAPKR